MTTPPGAQTVDELVHSYLERLHAAAATLPPDRRADLVEGITEHITAARAAGAAADEAAVRTLLDRLGQPEEIVAAARDDVDPVPGFGAPPSYSAPGYGPPAYAGVAARPAGTGLEGWAVAMLTVGSLIPFVGWLVGIALLWSSRRWTVGEKLLGTLVVPFGPGAVLYAGAFLPGETCEMTGGGGTFNIDTGVDTPEPVTTTCSSALPTVVAVPLAVAALVAPVVVAVLLYRRARVRAALEPPVPVVPAGARTWGALEITAVVLLSAGCFVLPVVGPLVGMVLVLLSDRWTGREKALGTAIALAPLLLLLTLGGVVALTAIGS